MDDIIDAARAGSLDGGAIRSVGPDAEYNRVVMDVQYMNDAFAAALVSRFGTDAIAVRVDPTYGPFSDISGPLETNAVDPVLVAVLVALSLAGLALAVLVMRRRATTVR
jgi:hypothetical protein